VLFVLLLLAFLASPPDCKVQAYPEVDFTQAGPVLDGGRASITCRF